MFGRFTAKQILLAIVGVIVLLWLIKWFTTSTKTTTVAKVQTVPTPAPVQNTTPIGPETNTNTPYVLHYFYSPNCGWCRQFAPTWNQVAQRVRNLQGVSTKSVNAEGTENDKNLAFYYNVKQYPTIILQTPTKYVEYNGNRTADDLYNFVTANMEQQ